MHGHGLIDVTGLTMDENPRKIWSLSARTFSDLTSQVKMMGGSDNVKEKTTHKEETPSHIASDKKDRKALRETLSLRISPFNPDEHHVGELLNIITGQHLAPQKGNVDEAKEKGEMQLKAYCESWPSGLYRTFKKEVVPSKFI